MLEQEITSIKKRIIEYAALVEKMIEKSTQGLVDKNEETLRQIIDKDEPQANNWEIDIEEQTTIILAKYQPTAKDLRIILMVSKMNNDLERMADHAVNIAEGSLYLIEKPTVKPLIDLPRMAKTTKKMLEDSIDSFVKEDSKLAKSVCERDPQIDGLKDQILRELITYMISDPATIERSIRLIQITSSLERIADLSTNICEDVIFIVEGRVIKHHKEEQQ
ncbi:phosphate signaling complex protein PhoU [bacterium]|nr:phosphate signaling complex protein PhoU [bacterium]